MKFRMITALAVAAAMSLPFAAYADEAATDITLWTYPIGSWGDSATVEGLIAGFEEAHPEIHVTVEYLDYTNGDDQVNTAIEGGQAPDLVLEGPERLVANWGAKGLMVDLGDLWTDEAKDAIYDSVEKACQNNDGVFYEYPLCMTAHTMAINRDLFEEAGALQYVDEETRTWTTENFVKAVEALVAYGQDNVGAVYCSGQGGDQGTRALVNNLCGGIWGFGIFNNGDDARIAAAKTFIDFMANDEIMGAQSVLASSYWPVKDLGNIYEGNDLMTEYAAFIPYMGDYYQVVGGWAQARTAWWNMLQQIGSGTDVSEAVTEFTATANAAVQ